MLSKFIEYLERQVKEGAIYVWGGQGEIATDALIDAKETSNVNALKAKALLKKRIKAGYAKVRMFDCSGLVTEAMSAAGMEGDKFDATADALMKTHSEVIDVPAPGDLVFRVKDGKAFHVGVIVDGGYNVIEAKGRADGVVKRGISASGGSYWNAFARLKKLKGEIAPPASLNRELKLTSPLTKGEDVRAVQTALIAKGYPCGSTGADGEYGKNTASAVKKFQRATGLKEDGITGEKTALALGVGWKDVLPAALTRELRLTSPLTKGEDVRAVQTALIAKGYSCGNSGADGEYGKNTMGAVKKFQRAAGLKEDGITGEKTALALGVTWKAL